MAPTLPNILCTGASHVPGTGKTGLVSLDPGITNWSSKPAATNPGVVLDSEKHVMKFTFVFCNLFFYDLTVFASLQS